MIPTIDKTIVVYLAALLVGFLEMHGLINPSQHNEDLQIAQTYVGGALDAVAIIAWFAQHHLTQKIKIQNGVIEVPSTTINVKTYLTAVKNFLLKTFSKTPTTTPQTPPEGNPPQQQ